MGDRAMPPAQAVNQHEATKQKIIRIEIRMGIVPARKSLSVKKMSKYNFENDESQTFFSQQRITRITQITGQTSA
jgi:hypothetical protein